MLKVWLKMTSCLGSGLFKASTHPLLNPDVLPRMGQEPDTVFLSQGGLIFTCSYLDESDFELLSSTCLQFHVLGL